MTQNARKKYDRGAPWTKIRFGGTVLEEKIVRKSREATRHSG